jgi:hypothetical protein
MIRSFRPQRPSGRRRVPVLRPRFTVGLEWLERRQLLAVDVTNLDNAGLGSLRAAIEAVNLAGVPDTIIFRDLGAGTIRPGTNLPPLTATGTTFQFAGNTTSITIDGTDAGPLGDGLVIGKGVNSITLSGIPLTIQYFARNGLSFEGASTGTTINGLSLRSNGFNGIQFAGGSYSGTTVRNTQIIDNGRAGIVTAGPVTGLSIGGTLANQGNTIAANGQSGIELAAGSSTGLVIAGNNIIDNTQAGIATAGGVAGATIGGTTAGARNTMALNKTSGIQLGPGSYAGTVIQGNAVSFNDGAGITFALGEGGSATGLTIGGLAAGMGNEISGNGTAGIVALAGTYTGTTILGNAIRINTSHGVSLAPAAGTITGLTVGGASSAVNRITGNGGDGVNVQAGTYTGTSVRANTISDNTGAGIRLAPGGGSLTALAVGGSSQSPPSANRLVGNQVAGIVAEAGTYTGTVIQGNQISGSVLGISLAGAQQLSVGGGTVDLGNSVTGAQQGLLATGNLAQTTAQFNTFTNNTVGVEISSATGFAFGTPTVGNWVNGGNFGILARGVLDNTSVQGNAVRNAVAGIVLDNARGSAAGSPFRVGGPTTAFGNAAGNNVLASTFGLFATGQLDNTFVAGNILRATAFGGNGAALVTAAGLMLGGGNAADGNLLTAELGNGLYAKGLCANSQVYRNTITASQYGIVLDAAQNLFVGFLYDPSLGNLVQYNQIGLVTLGNNSGTGVTYTNWFNNVLRDSNAGNAFIFPA